MFKKMLVVGIVSVVGAVNFAMAQTEEVESSGSGGNAIFVTSSVDESGGLGTTFMAMEASDLGGGAIMFDPGMAGTMGGMGIAGSDFSLLNNASVQKDLNLVDGQLHRIEEINKQFREKMQEQMELMKDEDGNFNINGAAGMAEVIKELREQQEEEVKSILLPNQKDRLQQVARRMKMKRMGSEKALTDLLAEELGLTDEQKKNIKQKSRQLRDDLNKQIAELKAKAKKELFEELTKDQRRKFEELMGDEFVEKDEDLKSPLRRMLRTQRKLRDF